MRKPLCDVNVFKQRRAALAQLIPDSAVIVTAHPEYIRNDDVHHTYRQDSNMFYLTGYEEPESVLLFRPGKTPETTVFVRPKNIERETWDGFRFGPELAKEHYNFDACYPIEEFSERAPKMLAEVSKVYYRLFCFPEWDKIIQEAILGVKRLRRRSGVGNLPIEDAGQLIGEMRLIKSDFDLSQMRKAAEITCRAHREVMSAAAPGVSERALHGVFIKSILESGAAREAYGGIFASGSNATTLHYVFNDQLCKEGDLLLVDAGGEYNYFASDITRTFPVSKKFNGDQKRIYQRVLDLQKSLIGMVKPGFSLHGMQKEAISGLVDIMLDEKLLSGNKQELISSNQYLRYYPHGVGHWLGMDVHDAGLSIIGGEPRPFVQGMVFTVEPGIYIPEGDLSAPKGLRGLGIRIEDNVVVTSSGCEVLTAAAPKEVDSF